MKHLFGVAALALATGCISVKDSGGGTRAFTSGRPTGTGTAIFTKEIGLQDTAINFEVFDPKADTAPITIGFVGDANWKGEMPKNAVWSKDGSVIAVQGADFKSWSHAYDFKRSDQSLCDVYPPEKRAAAIEKLLTIRGGIGAKVMDDWAKFDQVARPVAQDGR